MNGFELLTKIDGNQNTDLILMDIEMPVLNGIENTELIKQKYPHIKIIMLTVFVKKKPVFIKYEPSLHPYTIGYQLCVIPMISNHIAHNGGGDKGGACCSK
ncbi:response regulator [Subsaximicrobium wynnwilliamsii]|uniref:response regulator n=1 Tax=Subsaximicrobium wynnwilliamsii TaxID=291179 RepID=UPI001CB9A974|nr:response regulator [Subsaximicrobium wynnwilliamsii]